MSWICYRHPIFFPSFSAFSSIFYTPSRQILDKRPCTCATHGIHVSVPMPRLQSRHHITWLMRHQPALITCLHSRLCFWTLGPRPLSIVPTISARFRRPPISYHPCKFSHWATYALGIPTAIAPFVSLFDPQPVSPLSFYGSSIVLTNPLVPHTDNGSHVALLFCTVYKHPL